MRSGHTNQKDNFDEKIRSYNGRRIWYPALAHEQGPATKATAADLSIGGNKMRVAGVFNRTAQSPFRGGEATNRVLAFTVTRRKLIEDFGKGKLQGKDGQQFTGKIDDDNFLDIVVDQAKVVALVI